MGCLPECIAEVGSSYVVRSWREAALIDSVASAELTDKLLEEHPAWSPSGARAEADRLLSELDERLSGVLASYVRTGATDDYAANGVSLLGLQAMLSSTYLETLEVMSVHLSDPARARSIVTRRGVGR